MPAVRCQISLRNTAVILGIAGLCYGPVIQFQEVGFSYSKQANKLHQKGRSDKHARRPRDNLPEPPAQAQINLAWTKVRARKQHQPSRLVAETLSTLDSVLRDPAMLLELERAACFGSKDLPLPGSLSAALLTAAKEVLGQEASFAEVSTTGWAESSPELAILSPGRPATKYDRIALAQCFGALPGIIEARVGRRTISLTLEESTQANSKVDLEIAVGELLNHPPSSGKRLRRPCTFSCRRLVGSEDWEDADHLMQEQLQKCLKAAWAISMGYFCVSRITQKRKQRDSTIAGRRKAAVGNEMKPEVLEFVFRNLAQRIIERDKLEEDKAEMLSFVETSLADREALSSVRPGRRLLLAMASEVLDWHRSGILSLWLKDAEDAGLRQEAESLLNEAAMLLQDEVWALVHTQICQEPVEEELSIEARADQQITAGIRLIHFGRLEEARLALNEAKDLLAGSYIERAQLLSLANQLSFALLYHREGCLREGHQLEASCAKALRPFTIPDQVVPKPMSCWHNIALLLRAPFNLPEVASRGSQRRTRQHYEDEGLDDPTIPSHHVWPNVESTGVSSASALMLHQEAPRGKVASIGTFEATTVLGYLMPLTTIRLKSNELEVLRVTAGLARTLNCQ